MQTTNMKLTQKEIIAKNEAAFDMQLQVCQFISKPKGIIENKFVAMITTQIESLVTLPVTLHAPYIARIKKLLDDPALVRTDLNIAIPVFKQALEKDGLNFAKFWQSCLNGMPQTKLLY